MFTVFVPLSFGLLNKREFLVLIDHFESGRPVPPYSMTVSIVPSVSVSVVVLRNRYRQRQLVGKNYR